MILISAAGSGGTNRMVEGVKEEGFVGITNDRYKYFASILKKNYLVADASDEDAYIDAINSIVKRESVTLFIPNSDREVYVAAKNKERIAARTFLSDFDFVDLCFDKLTTHRAMERNGIASAKTFHIKSDEDIEKAFATIKQRPLWCRVRLGSGSKHTSKVLDVADAKCFIERSCTLYGLEKEDFLISEYLGGDDIAVMTLWKEGEAKMCKMAKRVSYDGYPGEAPPNIIESFYDKEVEKFVISSIRKLAASPNGVINVDIKCYEDGALAITEINPGRFYYNMSLFNYGKINAFALFLDLARGRECGFLYDDPEVVFIREQDNPPKVIRKELLESV